MGTMAVANSSFAQVFDLNDTTTQFIRIVGAPIEQNNGLLNIGEIAFEGAQSVPEPLSIVLMGLGLAGIGFSRKKKSV